MTVPSADPAAGSHLAQEIAEQPDALARLLDRELAGIRGAASRIRGRQPRFVMLLGRGTSGNAADYLGYLIQTELSLPTGRLLPSVATVLGGRLRLPDALVIAISQAGSSPDLVEALASARQAGAMTVALTNAPSSQLADHADEVVDLQAGPERAVPATKSYTTSILAGYLLVDALRGSSAEQARAVPAAAAAALHTEGVATLAGKLATQSPVLTLSRGHSLSTAAEAGLKITEMCGVPHHAYSAAELSHGAIVMVQAGWQVIAIRPAADKAAASVDEAVRRLVDQGAHVTTLRASRDGSDEDAMVLPHRLPELLRPAVDIIPLQLAALLAALATDLNPDNPSGLRKVTLTT